MRPRSRQDLGHQKRNKNKNFLCLRNELETWLRMVVWTQNWFVGGESNHDLLSLVRVTWPLVRNLLPPISVIRDYSNIHPRKKAFLASSEALVYNISSFQILNFTVPSPECSKAFPEFTWRNRERAPSRISKVWVSEVMAGTNVFPSPFLFQGWSWLGKLTSGKSNHLWPVHGRKARRGLEEGWKKSLQTQTSKYFKRRRQNQLAWKAGSRTCRWSFKRTRQISVDIEEGRFHPKTTWPEEKVPQNGQKSWEWRWGKM